MYSTFQLPDDLIVFISGIPGVGKTTISHRLLKEYDQFRIVEETDIIRDALRGYNQHLKTEYNSIMTDEIYPHSVFLTYEMARQQCKIMKLPIVNIVDRQRRKKIPSIINGVHIIPEELYAALPSSNIVYINLFINSEEALWDRLKNRNPEKYTRDILPLLFRANLDLNNSLERIPKPYSTYSLDVSSHGINDTMLEIQKILRALFLKN